MNQLLQTLTRYPKVMIFLSALAVSLMLITGCGRAGQKGETGSGFFGARVDTVTVRDTITLRDTIVVLDTLLVEREVPKEVVKKVLVPAEIPMYYERAWKKQAAEFGADFADEKTCFSGLDSMEVSVVMNEDAKDILSEQRAKDKFELTLRRYGVPLSNWSNPHLSLGIEALWNEEKRFVAFTINVSLKEPLIFYRNQKPYKRFIKPWEEIHYGYAGKDVARGAFLRYIEEKAERVANLYLSAN